MTKNYKSFKDHPIMKAALKRILNTRNISKAERLRIVAEVQRQLERLDQTARAYFRKAPKPTAKLAAKKRSAGRPAQKRRRRPKFGS